MKGYISLQEEHGKWSEHIKYLPINLHAEDFLTILAEEQAEQSFD